MILVCKNVILATCAALVGIVAGLGGAAAQETYVVRPGDSLASIARGLRRPGVTWQDLCNINFETLSECDSLQVGRRIMLPGDQEAIESDADATLAEPTEPAVDDALARFEDALTRATSAPPPNPEQQNETADNAAAADGRVTRDVRLTFGDAEQRQLPTLGADARVTSQLAYGPGAHALEFRSFHMHEIERNGDGSVRLSGHLAGLYSTGTTGGAFLRVEDDFEAQAAGGFIRVSVTMSGNDGATAGIAYSTNDLGNSGWHLFELTSDPTTHSFEYAVPPVAHGQGDFLGIDPDPEGVGQSVIVHEILFEILELDPA